MSSILYQTLLWFILGYYYDFFISVGTRPALCNLNKKIGPCKAGILRFFFNKKTGKCESFKYGGCHGNKNNFKTNAACVQTCVFDLVVNIEQQRTSLL